MKTLIKKFVPSFLLSWYHLSLSLAGAFLYRFPSRKLKVIGVTGTNGKTTVVHLATQILEEAGFKTASLSSIRFKIGERERPNTLKMTMPGRFKLQKFLRQAVTTSCRYAVIEVTSEGVKQHRHRFIDFDIAVFTNLAPEHIEAHGGFEKYREAKGKLFKATREIHIINGDDVHAGYFMQFSAKEKLVYGLKDKASLLKNVQLLGEFNVYNALAAIRIGLSQGISLDVCQKAVAKIENIPGRMEVVVEEPFSVIIDYAHTPDALEKVYQTLANLHKYEHEFHKSAKISGQICDHSRLICVLGACGGGRDRWKRPELGRIAAKYCDQIILTNEDPYDENPQHILNQIESGFSQISNSPKGPSTQRFECSAYGAGKSQIPNYEKILDRREAIKKALSLAKPGDAVIITGKGSEFWMCVAGGEKIPWNEKKVIKEEWSKVGRRD